MKTEKQILFIFSIKEVSQLIKSCNKVLGGETLNGKEKAIVKSLRRVLGYVKTSTFHCMQLCCDLTNNDVKGFVLLNCDVSKEVVREIKSAISNDSIKEQNAKLTETLSDGVTLIENFIQEGAISEESIATIDFLNNARKAFK